MFAGPPGPHDEQEAQHGGPSVRPGLAPAPLSPEEFDAFMKAETERNARVIKTLNLKVE